MVEQGMGMNELDVKAGDYIAVLGRYNPSRVILYKVERLTKTQAVCERSERFRLSDGFKIGTSGGNMVHGMKATEKHLHQYKVQVAKQFVERLLKDPETDENVFIEIAERYNGGEI